MTPAHSNYLAALSDDRRRCLTDLHGLIKSILPEAEEVISYAMPAFRQGKHVVVGFAAFKRQLALYLFSGSVIPLLAADCAGFRTSKSGVNFTPENPLPETLVRKIIATRLDQIG